MNMGMPYKCIPIFCALPQNEESCLWIHMVLLFCCWTGKQILRMNHQYLMSNYLELNVNDIDDWLCIILLIIMTIFFAGLSVILFKIIYYRWEKIILIWKRFCVVRSHTCIIDFKIYFWSYLVGSSRRILTNILNRSLCGFYLFNTVHEGERKAFFKVFLLY